MATKRTKSTKKPPPKPGGVTQGGAYDAAIDGTARAVILGALTNSKGSRTQAAAALGITLRRFYREIERLGMEEELAKHAAAQGWPPNPGSLARWG